MKPEVGGRKSEAGRGEGNARRPVSPSKRKASRGRAESDEGAAGTVAVVGAGRLGGALARSLASRGYEVRALVSSSAASARKVAAVAGVEALALGARHLERLPQVELLFVTTPDGVIEETAARLAALPRPVARIALHASGALSSEALAPLGARGLAVGSMHPLAAVSDPVAGAESLRGAFYCVEGDARAVRFARRVVRDLGGRSFTIDAGDKVLYHAAALMAAGHVVALFDVAADTLARCGLGERRAREVLLPLLRSTVENLSRQTTERALTGSFARMDIETVRKHLCALRELRGSDALSVYAPLGEHSLRLALRAASKDPGEAGSIWHRIWQAVVPEVVNSGVAPPRLRRGGEEGGPGA